MRATKTTVDSSTLRASETAAQAQCEPWSPAIPVPVHPSIILFAFGHSIPLCFFQYLDSSTSTSRALTAKKSPYLHNQQPYLALLFFLFLCRPTFCIYPLPKSHCKPRRNQSKFVATLPALCGPPADLSRFCLLKLTLTVVPLFCRRPYHLIIALSCLVVSCSTTVHNSNAHVGLELS